MNRKTNSLPLVLSVPKDVVPRARQVGLVHPEDDGHPAADDDAPLAGEGLARLGQVALVLQVQRLAPQRGLVRSAAAVEAVDAVSGGGEEGLLVPAGVGREGGGSGRGREEALVGVAGLALVEVALEVTDVGEALVEELVASARDNGYGSLHLHDEHHGLREATDKNRRNRPRFSVEGLVV